MIKKAVLLTNCNQQEGLSSPCSQKAHWFKLPGRACQPESDSPMRTWYSILRSVFADLGIVFFGIATDFSQQKRQVLPWLIQRKIRSVRLRRFMQWRVTGAFFMPIISW